MSTTPLASLGAGFSNEAFGSQAVFRAVLQALSHPGRTVAVEHDAQAPSVGHAASAAVLLALLDSDCTLWLSPRLAASDAGAWLRFHTGCTVVVDAAQARFVWVAQGDALPALGSLAQGTDIYPDQSATCVVDVSRAAATTADASDAWHLRGPGIQEVAALQVDGLPDEFEAQWAANHGVFPCGVDLLLATADHIVGLPRTTRATRGATALQEA
ncbi:MULTISPECIES: phosphonate C-P lyase system protein PhnH [Acidovorax]|uniref:Phosphonate C-P lyase system protein PhnH n=1 Tax=Acidovorax facilis TaxID=12917 RepID=A0ABV8DD23_9BURK|nr:MULTISPECIES: phosphonate C-P lyase system protein PhnH [Acidovorax]KQB59226.1 phosphonate metabolism protein PhnH [Acidovorax sp. SD340]MBO1007782.1 phosphonate C-P lyase system protein PhnH [Acidovorax sp. SD340]MCO4241279.1 phosphonate C-P lyase system protein PhnH [Acidovorax facilis]